MIKLAFFNNKGGCSKSTSSINVAHCMSRAGKKVLVVDCDSQQNTFFFFSERDNVYTNSHENPTRYKNLYISKGTYCRTNNDGDKSELAISHNYDYAILDMPCNLDKQTSKIISNCDYVFVPIELGTFAIQGIANVTDSIASTGAKFGGCFVSKFDRNNPADHELDKLLRSTLASKAMKTRIPLSRVIKNSVSYRQTAFDYMEWTEAAGAYTNLTREIMLICGGGENNA